MKSNDIVLLVEKRGEIVSALRKIGFAFVTLDLERLASGKLNRTIEDVLK
ncbi:hypothetical protein [Thermotoga sp.]|nr:hypothetical protein [Thermotoga sp.]